MPPDPDLDGEVVDPDRLGAFARRYFDAWNSHEPAAVAGCAREDVVWESPALPEPARGRGGVAALVASTVAAFPDYTFTPPSPWAIADDARTAYVPWRMAGTYTGSFDPPGYAPTGRPVDLSGIDVWRFRDGLIWHYRAVYDFSALARQLGLAPPRRGRLERVAVRAQRLFIRMRPSGFGP